MEQHRHESLSTRSQWRLSRCGVCGPLSASQHGGLRRRSVGVMGAQWETVPPSKVCLPFWPSCREALSSPQRSLVPAASHPLTRLQSAAICATFLAPATRSPGISPETTASSIVSRSQTYPDNRAVFSISSLPRYVCRLSAQDPAPNNPTGRSTLFRRSYLGPGSRFRLWPACALPAVTSILRMASSSLVRNCR